MLVHLFFKHNSREKTRCKIEGFVETTSLQAVRDTAIERMYLECIHINSNIVINHDTWS